MSRTIQPIDRTSYDGRRLLDRVVTDRDGFMAFDAEAKPIARFNNEAAAAQAVFDLAREATDVR